MTEDRMVRPILKRHSLGFQTSAMTQGSNGRGEDQGPSTPQSQVTASGDQGAFPLTVHTQHGSAQVSI